MAQFTPYKANIKVDPSLLKPYVEVEIRGREKRQEILNRHGITFDNPERYYPLETVLLCFKDILRELGEMNLFLVGRICLQKVPFQCRSLKEAIERLNLLHHIHHTLDDMPMYNPHTHTFLEGIGGYKVLQYEEDKRYMVVRSDTHFSSKSDEGAITGLLEQFLPSDSKGLRITLDITQERRSLGGDSCTYIIRW